MHILFNCTLKCSVAIAFCCFLFSCNSSNNLHESYKLNIKEFCKLSNFDQQLNCSETSSEIAEIEMIINQSQIEITALIFEDDIKARFKTRDTTLYLENCFEIFFDPGADGIDYYEIEINAVGTLYDLKLKNNKSYDLKTGVLKSWDIPNKYIEVSHEGTINTPSDIDKYWKLRAIIPNHLIKEGLPKSGDVWSFNFMVVDTDAESPVYWVWKPTGGTRIHLPETWPRINF